MVLQQALKQAKEWQTVLELAQSKRQDAHDVPACPFSKFITSEAIQGGVITLTTTQRSLDSMTWSVFFKQQPASRFSGVMDRWKN